MMFMKVEGNSMVSFEANNYAKTKERVSGTCGFGDAWYDFCQSFVSVLD